MKAILAVALLLVLLSGPVLCNALVCNTPQQHHDCCPKRQAVSNCPYDFLTHSTGAVRLHSAPDLAVVAPISIHAETLIPLAGHERSTVAAGGCNLHAIQRVLRI